VAGAVGRGARALAGLALGLVARLWLATLRVRVRVAPELLAHADVPWVLAFLHGAQWPLLAVRRRRPTVAMVSHSRDGDLQARALRVVGLEVVRGSSSRGGARGLAALVRRTRRGADAAFAVDGPRGPYGVPKPGVLAAARASGAIVVPMGSAMRRGKVLTKAWDRFALAWPFTEVSVVYGAPLELPASPGPRSGHEGMTSVSRPPAADADATLATLARAIEAAQEEAAGMLLLGDPKVVSSLKVFGALPASSGIGLEGARGRSGKLDRVIE